MIELILVLWAFLLDIIWWFFIAACILTAMSLTLEALGAQWSSDAAKLFDNIPGSEESHDDQYQERT